MNEYYEKLIELLELERNMKHTMASMTNDTNEYNELLNECLDLDYIINFIKLIKRHTFDKRFLDMMFSNGSICHTVNMKAFQRHLLNELLCARKNFPKEKEKDYTDEIENGIHDYLLKNNIKKIPVNVFELSVKLNNIVKRVNNEQ